MKRMRILGLAIDNSRIGFRRYVGSYNCFIRRLMELRMMETYVTSVKLKELADASRVVELDNKFRSLLTKEEKAAVSYFGYHNISFTQPKHYLECVDTAFAKWQSVFFDKENLFIGEINAFALGNVFKHIRETKGIKKSELARDVGVDRNTISSFENGKRLPSLVYMYKFSKLFDISIDEIITVCLNDH